MPLNGGRDAMYPQQEFAVPSFESSGLWCGERPVGGAGPVARRNERERKRVRLVNMGFAKLRQYIPVTGRPGKRLSKVETLRSAIDYIRQLRQMLRQPPEPPYYYSSPPQRLPHQDPVVSYRCDFGCPCNEGVPEYGYEGSPEMIVSYVQDHPYMIM